MLAIKDRILYEDNHLIIINKASSEIVQGDKTGDETLGEKVQKYIKIRDEKPGNVFLGVTHRLDRPTSGLVVFAKTSKALSRMNVLFREHHLKKTYWAILEKAPRKDAAQLVDYLRRDRNKNRSFCCDSGRDDAKKAVLSYEVLNRIGSETLVEVDLETGRHHQIRAQFSGRGCPIKGDLKYGAKAPNSNGSIHLHARKIVFVHPVSKVEITVVAPVPRNDILWQEFETNSAREKTGADD
jgi:23S rRNA pseudouridine1911/1915/1917 synthase